MPCSPRMKLRKKSIPSRRLSLSTSVWSYFVRCFNNLAVSPMHTTLFLYKEYSEKNLYQSGFHWIFFNTFCECTLMLILRFLDSIKLICQKNKIIFNSIIFITSKINIARLNPSGFDRIVTTREFEIRANEFSDEEIFITQVDLCISETDGYFIKNDFLFNIYDFIIIILLPSLCSGNTGWLFKHWLVSSFHQVFTRHTIQYNTIHFIETRLQNIQLAQ